MHYVVNLSVQEVTSAVPAKFEYGKQITAEVPRQVDQVVSLVLKAPSLEEALSRVARQLAAIGVSE